MSTAQLSHSCERDGAARLELRFASRVHERRSLAFPCDPMGRVDLDALGERDRIDYLFARALMQRDYAFPVVVTQVSHAS
jgi:hypothetical protein